MKIELEGVIEESIPDSAFVAGLSESVTELPPDQAVAAVKAFCARQITPAMQATKVRNLRQEAEEIKIEKDESIDDYIHRHSEHRLGMVRLNVPGSDEPSYVLTILRGLDLAPRGASQSIVTGSMATGYELSVHLCPSHAVEANSPHPGPPLAE